MAYLSATAWFVSLLSTVLLLIAISLLTYYVYIYSKPGTGYPAFDLKVVSVRLHIITYIGLFLSIFLIFCHSWLTFGLTLNKKVDDPTTTNTTDFFIQQFDHDGVVHPFLMIATLVYITVKIFVYCALYELLHYVVDGSSAMIFSDKCSFVSSAFIISVIVGIITLGLIIFSFVIDQVSMGYVIIAGIMYLLLDCFIPCYISILYFYKSF